MSVEQLVSQQPQQQQTQDLFVQFNNDKDLRNFEIIKIKAALYSGISIKVRKVTDQNMENILYAIETATNIVHLRFEEVSFTRNAINMISEFLKTKSILDSIGFKNIVYDDQNDHKRIFEGLTRNQKIKQLILQQNIYDIPQQGEWFQSLVTLSRHITEIDLSWSEFKNPQIFYEMANGLVHEKARINTFKMRGFQIGKIESKVIQLLLQQNKTIVNFDLSYCYGPTEHFCFLSYFDKFSCQKHVLMDSLKTDISEHMEFLGEALSENTKLEHLSIKENKTKASAQIAFWQGILPNRTLRYLNMEKNKVTDKVVPYISEYLIQYGIALTELSLARNTITGQGLITLSRGISNNTSLKKLNLSYNQLEEEGLNEFSIALIDNHEIEELYLSGNAINNQGLAYISQTIQFNQTLKLIDISKNNFGDQGMSNLAEALKANVGLVQLNIPRNLDITDEDGLIQIAECLKHNKFLQVLDITGIKVRKPCLRQFFLPALSENIFLQKILGKIPPNIVTDELADNIIIEKELVQCITTEKHDNQVWIKLQNKKSEVLRAAIKLIRLQAIECVDLTNMGIGNDQLKLIANYLQENHNLKKLILNDNIFNDDGFQQIIDVLAKNTTLNHLSIMRCTNITNTSIALLNDLVSTKNMSLYSVDLEMTQFDKEHVVSIMKQSALNKSIQKHLQPYSKQVTRELHTVQFRQDAKLVDHFESVVKCWKILKPNYINLTNEDIEDQHVKQMSSFLLNQKGIEQLILRRNKIENVDGIAAFIEKNDKYFKHLEISRNNIKDSGALKILKAMRKNTRITTFLFDFGNQISSKLANKIEKEVKANHHIEQFVKPSLAKQHNNDHYGKLSIQDKGPAFLRCALKSATCFSLIELNLSDNLLTYPDCNKICHVIRDNYPLKRLNLSNNLLDSKSGELISQSLRTNTHLIELDLSYNKIRDHGISMVILPIAKQNLHTLVTGVQSSQKRISIRKLFFQYNEHTTEALKHVYALLFADKQIVVEINMPKNNHSHGDPHVHKNTVIPISPLRRNNSPLRRANSTQQNVQKKFHSINLGRFAPLQPRSLSTAPFMKQRVRFSQAQEQNSSIQVQDQKADQVDLNMSVINQFQDSKLNDVENTDPENLNDTHSKIIIKQDQNKSNDLTINQFLFGKTDEKVKKSKCQNFFLVRFYKDAWANKREALMFKCNENILSKVETISQTYVTLALYFSSILFYYAAIFIPLQEKNVCEEGHKYSTYAYYFIYTATSFIMEFVLSIYLYKKVGDREAFTLNKFHIWKMAIGQLAKADFFTDILFQVEVYSCGIMHLFWIGAFVLLLSMIYYVFMMIKLLKTEKNHLLSNIERNCKLAYVTEHQCLAIILDAFSLSNFESVGEKTITIPKIVSSIKSFVEDMPQFTLQMVYLMKYSEDSQSIDNVIVSLLLGLFSFSLSVHHAFHAKSSNVNVQKVQAKIEERQALFSDIDIDYDFIDLPPSPENLKREQPLNQNVSNGSLLQIEKIEPLFSRNREQYNNSQQRLTTDNGEKAEKGSLSFSQQQYFVITPKKTQSQRFDLPATQTDLIKKK